MVPAFQAVEDELKVLNSRDVGIMVTLMFLTEAAVVANILLAWKLCNLEKNAVGGNDQA